MNKLNWPATRAYFIARAKEGTTWSGLILIVTAVAGANMTAEYVAGVQQVGMLLAGAVAVAVKS